MANGHLSSAASRSREPVNYRTSCDRCLNIKIRCSQEKPICKRCGKKGFDCIYSPLRRIGRPKKTSRDDLIAIENTAIPKTLPSGSLSSDSSAVATIANRHNDYIQNAVGSLVVGVAGRSIDNDIQRRNNSHTAQVDSSTKPYEIHKEIGLRDADEPLSGDQVMPHVLGCEKNCYIAILSRTTKLEQLLIISPQPPLLDLILEAEQDVRALKEHLFTCTGHSIGNSTCLGSNRPVLLSLALLAECVVGMLEKVFSITAVSSHTIDQEPQEVASSDPLSVKSAPARGIARSFRGLLDQSYTFPIPDSNIDMRIGDYLLEGPVKARVTERIFQLRIRKLIVALEEMRTVPQKKKRGSPLDWDDSGDVLDQAARSLLEDLIRRLESLQGGMALL